MARSLPRNGHHIAGATLLEARRQARGQVEVTFVVNRPVETVPFWHLENNLKAVFRATEAKKVSAGPIGVGTTYRMVNRVFGRRLEGDKRSPNTSPTGSSRAPGSEAQPIIAQRIFEPVVGGTRVKFIATVEPRGFLELAERLLAKRARGQLEADAANVKRLLEADAR